MSENAWYTPNGNSNEENDDNPLGKCEKGVYTTKNVFNQNKDICFYQPGKWFTKNNLSHQLKKQMELQQQWELM